MPPAAYPAEIQPLSCHQAPATLFNGMIHPLVPIGIRGAIWYQGENTGQVVVHDIGNLRDIQPRNKQDVGTRMALIALAKTYGRPKTVYSGPAFKSLTIDGEKLRVTFDHVGSGLVPRDGKPLDWFEIIGKGTDFAPVKARIGGESVVLSSPEGPTSRFLGDRVVPSPQLVMGAFEQSIGSERTHTFQLAVPKLARGKKTDEHRKRP